MERDEDRFNKLNRLTCSMLGKLANVEDRLDVLTIFAEELLTDIRSVVRISDDS